MVSLSTTSVNLLPTHILYDNAKFQDRVRKILSSYTDGSLQVHMIHHRVRRFAGSGLCVLPDHHQTPNQVRFYVPNAGERLRGGNWGISSETNLNGTSMTLSFETLFCLHRIAEGSRCLS